MSKIAFLMSFLVVLMLPGPGLEKLGAGPHIFLEDGSVLTSVCSKHVREIAPSPLPVLGTAVDVIEGGQVCSFVGLGEGSRF